MGMSQGGDAPCQSNATQPRAVECFQPVAQSKAMLLSSWQMSSVVCPSSGGEMQTASETHITAFPFHIWQGCLMTVPEGKVLQTSVSRASCLAAASDHREHLKLSIL